MKLKKQICVVEPIPKYYGKCYRDWVNDRVVCYPIPLNWIVKVFRELEYWIRFPQWTDSWERKAMVIRDKAWYEGYNFGVAAAEFKEELERTKKKSVTFKPIRKRFDVQALREKEKGFDKWLNSIDKED